MFTKIFITHNLYIIAGVSDELSLNIRKAYITEEVTKYLPCDIIVNCEEKIVKIRYFDIEMSCTIVDFDFNFITAIENIVVKKFNGLIYHGSAVAYNNQCAIAFMGSSGSGKTTIVEMLESFSPKFTRISDDVLMIDDTKLCKTYLPIKLKKTIHDGIKEIKSVFPNNLPSDFETFELSSIISIHYNVSSNVNEFTQLDTLGKIKTLINNSRSSPSNSQLMKSIATISSSVLMYRLNYSDNEYAKKIISILI